MNIRHSILSLLLICSCVVAASNSQASNKFPAKQDLAAGSALLVDLNNGEVLYERNADTVVAIASLTKLMTAMVTLDAKQPLDQPLSIRIASNPDMHGVFSRVRVGSELSRRDMLLLALMASENRAANSLAEHHPGGYGAFIRAMNAKAQALGMRHTRFTEPTGLSADNRASARDLVLLLKAARQYPLIEQYSTQSEKVQHFRKPNYSLGFRNTNALVRKAEWSIQLSKTGFTNEAGRCLVMNTRMKNRQVAFVVLDAFGKYTHMADANRLKRYLETGRVTPVPAAAISYREQKLAQRRQQGQ